MLNRDNATPVEELIGPNKVHRRVFTDPAVFDAEMRRIFRGTWVFLAHESEVPEPGSFKTEVLAGQPLIMTRDEDGVIHVLYNRCRHRGTVLTREPSGRAPVLICPFHGWTYSPTGELVAIPGAEAFGFGAELDQQDCGLVPVPRCDAYRGFIFVSLNANVPTLADHLGRAVHYIDRLLDRSPAGTVQVQKPIRSDYAGNWKHFLDQESFHAPILHASVFQVGTAQQADKYGSVPSQTVANALDQRYIDRDLGRGHGINDFGELRSRLWRDAIDDSEYRSLLAQRRGGPEAADELAESDFHLFLYPNVILFSRLNHFRVIRPLAVDRTELVTYPCWFGGAPERLNRLLVQYTGQHVSAGGEVNLQDLDIFARIQEGLQAEGVDWVLFNLGRGQFTVNEAGEREARGANEWLIMRRYDEWLRLMSGVCV
ncbi:MAG: Rieske 2Fe-2S domain-containing protein [Chloroflexi bacterium]|nr:Rieske 2Fe-2S domain-containing protein [Chloroflexota bacterium]